MSIVVTPEGFEPPTLRLGRASSVRLSYGAVEAETRVELV